MSGWPCLKRLQVRTSIPISLSSRPHLPQFPSRLSTVGLRDLAEAVSTEAGSAMKRFTRELVAPVVEFVGWEARRGEDSNAPLLRAMVLRTAAMCGVTGVVERCLALFDAYAAGGAAATPIAADMRALVYNTVAAEGGEARWRLLKQLFSSATSSEEQRRLMASLGRASAPALLSATLDMMLGACVGLAVHTQSQFPLYSPHSDSQVTRCEPRTRCSSSPPSLRTRATWVGDSPGPSSRTTGRRCASATAEVR
jgi:hypothetical protein